jgi:hypothetical protein
MKGTLMAGYASWRIALTVALAAVAGGAIAADPTMRKKGEPATFIGSSFGQLVTVIGDDDALTGTFDNDGKLKAKGNMDNPTYVGVWTASTSPTQCDAEKDGSSYWGKVTFQMSDAGRTYTGKWGYCDSEPDRAFEAKWDGN